MKTYIVMFLLIYKSVASQVFVKYTPNVGTVLFSQNDTKNERWTKAKLALLEARLYFQSLILPPSHIYMLNEGYINDLLKYFRETYVAAIRHSQDMDSATIMTAALSDVIGGYLKLWVLPIAKYSYYGGTLTHESTVKVFKFYKDVKDYLKTDGKGWHYPTANLLNSVAINVAPLAHITSSRSMKNPCDLLVFYEMTPKGLNIPIPQVNWDLPTVTMFVPLKNETLIPLSSPNSSYVLFKYYDVVKNCLRSINASSPNDFEDRFQEWLVNEVVPHLSDEELYPAFGSVLSLLNRTNDLSNPYNSGPYFTSFLCLPPKIFCKKVLVIVLILFVEVAWCIVALICMICAKCRKPECSRKSSVEDGDQEYRRSSRKESAKRVARSQLYSDIINCDQSAHFSIQSDNEGHLTSSVSDSISYYDSKFCSAEVLVKESHTRIQKVKRVPSHNVNVSRIQSVPERGPSRHQSLSSSQEGNKLSKHNVSQDLKLNVLEKRATIHNIERRNEITDNKNLYKTASYPISKSNLSHRPEPLPNIIITNYKKERQMLKNKSSFCLEYGQLPEVLEVSKVSSTNLEQNCETALQEAKLEPSHTSGDITKTIKSNDFLTDDTIEGVNNIEFPQIRSEEDAPKTDTNDEEYTKHEIGSTLESKISPEPYNVVKRFYNIANDMHMESTKDIPQNILETKQPWDEKHLTECNSKLIEKCLGDKHTSKHSERLLYDSQFSPNIEYRSDEDFVQPNYAIRMAQHECQEQLKAVAESYSHIPKEIISSHILGSSTNTKNRDPNMKTTNNSKNHQDKNNLERSNDLLTENNTIKKKCNKKDTIKYSKIYPASREERKKLSIKRRESKEDNRKKKLMKAENPEHIEELNTKPQYVEKESYIKRKNKVALTDSIHYIHQDTATHIEQGTSALKPKLKSHASGTDAEYLEASGKNFQKAPKVKKPSKIPKLRLLKSKAPPTALANRTSTPSPRSKGVVGQVDKRYVDDSELQKDKATDDKLNVTF